MVDVSAYELWRQAGGNPTEYRRLMVEHGLLIPLKPGETAEPLPCGWPTSRRTEPATGGTVAPHDQPTTEDGA